MTAKKNQGAPSVRVGTDGPWTLEPGAFAFSFTVRGASGERVADTGDVPGAKANAALIAAAPDLANALEAVLLSLGDPFTIEEHAALAQARAALRKAGRTP